MRLYLEGAEIWKGTTFLGIVSADWLATQIQDRLDNIEIAAWLTAELAADPTRHLGAPVDTTRPMLRKPLAFMPITGEIKAKRQAQRQKNKGRRAKAS